MPTLTEQLETLATTMAGVKSISVAHAEKLFSILDAAPDEGLAMIVARKVPFMWMPAARRLEDRKGQFAVSYSQHDSGSKSEGRMIRTGKQSAERSARLMRECGYKAVSIDLV